jgi:small basic protein (TIGR04137 family)
MSIDRSLRTKSSLARHRNVLSRAERVTLLKDQDRWTDELTPLGLPKVAHRKGKAGKKKAAAKAEGTAEAAPAAGAPAEAAAAKKS